jgi:hypothetical protein
VQIAGCSHNQYGLAKLLRPALFAPIVSPIWISCLSPIDTIIIADVAVAFAIVVIIFIIAISEKR